MDILAGLFTSIWNGLDELTIPIVEITIKEFLLALIIINISFALLNYFLGKHASSDKDE